MPNSLALEIWGGIECTINRVGERYSSQLARNGHLNRIESDIDAFASLGLSALRYPVLWEHVMQRPGVHQFAAADRAMRHLRASNLRPIVGLLHHGSGPAGLSVHQPAFPAKLSDFAASVARRYPWISDYTPVNEPLTTARFTGLYGHWYPHNRDDTAFVRILLNETRGTVLAMRAIRQINPDARLIQTEDLGHAQGTPSLRPQVEFENERRWLSFDLLCGRVVIGHPLYDYLTTLGGASRAELEWFADNPCPPDGFGINHYPRSNRWLDDRVHLHPPGSWGGNITTVYADVAACDTPVAESTTLSTLIEQTWRRYGANIALTEVHVAGSAQTQSQWWSNAVGAAIDALTNGIDVEAVTTWSLLGSFDWDTLCTTADGPVTYEPGAFDVSTGERLQTALADAIRQTADVDRSGSGSLLPAQVASN